MKSTFLILLVLFFNLAHSQENKSNYVFTNSIYHPEDSTIKIQGTNINLYLDTNSLEYFTHGIPNYYKNQKVIDGTYQILFLQDTTKKALDLTFKNGYLTTVKKYWFNDSLKAVGHLKYGQYEGTWKSYHSNGKVSSIFHYINGWHREFKVYYKTGILARHCVEHEIENKKYRLWYDKDYYKNGELMHEGFTKNGYKIKEWNYYQCDGTLKESIKHKFKNKLRLGNTIWEQQNCG